MNGARQDVSDDRLKVPSEDTCVADAYARNVSLLSLMICDISVTEEANCTTAAHSI